MDGMGEKLLEKIKIQEIFSFRLFGEEVIVSNSIVVMWVVMAVLIILSKILTKNFKTIPEGAQCFIEMVVDGINSFTKEVAGHHWKIIAPYVGTVFIFLITANTISIFNIIPEWEQLHEMTGLEFFSKLPKISFTPPTRDINVTVALGLVSVIMVAAASIKQKKVSGWLKSYIEPVPVILPMKIMENFIRMFSLGFRLFGNVLAAFIIMELIYFSIPLILPAGLSIYFDLFDGILQAFIFVFLTLLYMAEAVEE